MKITNHEEVSESRLTIVLDIMRDDCDEIYNSYCVKQGYEIVSENVDGNKLTVALKKTVTKKYI